MIENPRRPIRVAAAPPTSPAMPPTANAARAEREREHWLQHVRINAAHAAAVTAAMHNMPQEMTILDVAAAFEHYILTGSTVKPTEEEQ